MVIYSAVDKQSCCENMRWRSQIQAEMLTRTAKPAINLAMTTGPTNGSEVTIADIVCGFKLQFKMYIVLYTTNEHAM